MPDENGYKEDKFPLWYEIRRFSKGKIFIIILLFLGGLIGLIIPVIPGLLLIGLAIALLKPGLMEKIRKRFKNRD